MRTVAALVLGLAGMATTASGQATGPLNALTLPRAPESSVAVRPVLPAWVAMPQTARVLTSAGLESRTAGPSPARCNG